MEKEMQKFTLAIISFLCISFFMSCTPSPIPQKTQTALNTVCTIQLFEYGTEKIYTKLFDRLDEIEKRLSVTISSSEMPAKPKVSKVWRKHIIIPGSENARV